MNNFDFRCDPDYVPSAKISNFRSRLTKIWIVTMFVYILIYCCLPDSELKVNIKYGFLIVAIVITLYYMLN